MTMSALEEKRKFNIKKQRKTKRRKHMSNKLWKKNCGKDRRDHRWRYRHRPRRKRLHRGGRPFIIFGRRQTALDAAVADLGPNAPR